MRFFPHLLRTEFSLKIDSFFSSAHSFDGTSKSNKRHSNWKSRKKCVFICVLLLLQKKKPTIEKTKPNFGKRTKTVQRNACNVLLVDAKWLRHRFHDGLCWQTVWTVTITGVYADRNGFSWRWNMCVSPLVFRIFESKTWKASRPRPSHYTKGWARFDGSYENVRFNINLI